MTPSFLKSCLTYSSQMTEEWNYTAGTEMVFTDLPCGHQQGCQIWHGCFINCHCPYGHRACRDLLTLQSACALENKAQLSRQFLLSSLISFLLQSQGLNQGEGERSVTCLPTWDLDTLSFLEGHTVNILWACPKCLKMGAFFVSFCKSSNIIIPEKNMWG